MSHKIDERKDNIRKIKETIENTQDNIEFANDMIETIPNDQSKRTLQGDNKHRIESIDALQDQLNNQLIGKEKKNK